MQPSQQRLRFENENGRSLIFELLFRKNGTKIVRSHPARIIRPSQTPTVFFFTPKDFKMEPKEPGYWWWEDVHGNARIIEFLRHDGVKLSTVVGLCRYRTPKEFITVEVDFARWLGKAIPPSAVSEKTNAEELRGALARAYNGLFRTETFPPSSDKYFQVPSRRLCELRCIIDKILRKGIDGKSMSFDIILRNPVTGDWPRRKS